MKILAVVVSLTFLGFWVGGNPEAQDAAVPACEKACAAHGDGLADAAAELAGLSPRNCPIIGSEPGDVVAGAPGCSDSAGCSAKPAPATPGCSTASGCAAPTPGSTLVGCAPESSRVVDAEDEARLAPLVAHLKLLEAGEESGQAMSISKADVEAAVGFPIGQELLMAAITEVWPGAEVGGGSSRCSDFGACSLYGDLATATGEQLAFYTAEKEQDGRRFEDRPLPAFEARTLAGDAVESSELRGRLTLLVPLAVHCSHSYDTLPILHELAHEYGPRGLRIVGLLVNSGSPEDATLSLTGSPACHDFWVTEGDAVGKLLGSRLVPGHLLLDADGKVLRQFVGFKDGTALRAAIDPLLDA